MSKGYPYRDSPRSHGLPGHRNLFPLQFSRRSDFMLGHGCKEEPLNKKRRTRRSALKWNKGRNERSAFAACDEAEGAQTQQNAGAWLGHYANSHASSHASSQTICSNYRADGTLSPLPRGGNFDGDAHIPLKDFIFRP